LSFQKISYPPAGGEEIYLESRIKRDKCQTFNESFKKTLIDFPQHSSNLMLEVFTPGFPIKLGMTIKIM